MLRDHRASYGYTLVADKVIDPRTGRVKVNSAKWEIEKADADGNLIPNSPTWVVHNIFIWIGEQGRTCYWVANELNRLRIPPPQRETLKKGGEISLAKITLGGAEGTIGRTF